MAIDVTDILTQLREQVAPTLHATTITDLTKMTDMPVEVSWPDETGTSGETRRVIAVVVENSGDPEVPTLRLICGMNYDTEQPTAEEAQEALDHWHDAPKAPDFSQLDQRAMQRDPANQYYPTDDDLGIG